jgi:hypothetical protein
MSANIAYLDHWGFASRVDQLRLSASHGDIVESGESHAKMDGLRQYGTLS